MSDIIKIEHLNKCFGDVKAVNDLSFRVKKGESLCFFQHHLHLKMQTILPSLRGNLSH